MTTDLTDPAGRARLAAIYRDTLLDDVVPFWLRHGLDREHGGILTMLDRDGSVLDDDKSIWFQGRAGWMFATLHNTVEQRPEWLAAARSCVDFCRRHGHRSDGKMWFSVTRDGRPLRMRRYVFSESFAAIAYAAGARATGDDSLAAAATDAFDTYLRVSFEPGAMAPKYESTRPMKGLGAPMIAIVTAQEIRASLGEVRVRGRSCTEWIDACIGEIERDFLHADHRALLESVDTDGRARLEHADGRLLNPGHALECAWFIMHEGAWRGDRRLIDLGVRILDWTWERGWDREYGGIFYFRDLLGKPVLEYWHDMKFWWPHCEAILATLMAWRLTGEPRQAARHAQVHDWSFKHFPDPEHGEWFGYLHRDGRVSQPAKGSMYKGPFHLPRMLWMGRRLLEEDASCPPRTSEPPKGA
jgi:N-acylglucosamine 2-epimerase